MDKYFWMLYSQQYCIFFAVSKTFAWKISIFLLKLNATWFDVLLCNAKTFIHQSVQILFWGSLYQSINLILPCFQQWTSRCVWTHDNLRTYSDKMPADLLKPLSSSLVPSMVPSAWSCKWKPCRLYSFVTIPFSWGSARRQKVKRERMRKRQG